MIAQVLLKTPLVPSCSQSPDWSCRFMITWVSHDNHVTVLNLYLNTTFYKFNVWVPNQWMIITSYDIVNLLHRHQSQYGPTRVYNLRAIWLDVASLLTWLSHDTHIIIMSWTMNTYREILSPSTIFHLMIEQELTRLLDCFSSSTAWHHYDIIWHARLTLSHSACPCKLKLLVQTRSHK